MFDILGAMPTKEKIRDQELITLTKKKYEDLLDAKLRFEFMRYTFTEDFFSPPPTRDKKEVIDAFKATGKYSQKFLESLEQGLGRSSYFDV